MAGVRVVEVGAWVAGPAAGAVLADWGADVVKVEPLAGDPMRYVVTWGPDGVNPAFELENRGKRSIAVDVTGAAGRELVYALLAESDVFISNIRPSTLEALAFDPPTLRARFPHLIVATLNGYGDRGPQRDRPSYDLGGYWARSGLAATHTVDGGEPPLLRGAVGDHMASMSLVAGISAALYARSVSGEGSHVSTSLLRNGFYAGGQDANVLARAGSTLPMGYGRSRATNPLFICYRTKDERWLWLLGLQPDRHWPGVAIALEHPEWLVDERFESMKSRRVHAEALVELLDGVFAERTLDEWAQILEDAGVWWEPVATLQEVLQDEQLRAGGGLVQVPIPQAAGHSDAVASPVDFDGCSYAARRGTPELAEHTDEVLAEIGADEDDLRDWTERGVIG
jgi:crotonobetainyl-CoA:carnitine CoA-transferase CaiB-like acyl-CoA transferase